MPVCLAMGEAAGIAAALAVKLPDNDVHAVDIPTLRRRLQEEGAYLPEIAGADSAKPHDEAKNGVV